MSYKTYEEYKDSGIEWIGEIPKDWNVFKLKHVVNEFITGGTPKSSNDDFWDENNEGIPWVAISDMTDNDFINFTAKSLTTEGFASKNLRILKKGTLIFSIFASLGKVSILNIHATTNQAILGLITSNIIDKFYLKYYLEALREHIISFSNANTQDNLNTTIVKNIDIILPPKIDSQRFIVNFLDKKTLEIDKNIAKNKELISLLEEKKISLINQVITKGLNPIVSMKDSGVEWAGEIPEDWKVVKLKFLSENLDNQRVPISAANRKTGEIPYYGATGIVDYIDNYIFNEKLLLVGEDGAPFFDKTKNVSFLISGKSWVNNHVHVLKVNESLILNEIMMYCLNCTDYSLYIKGSTRDKLNQDQLNNIPIILPPLYEQTHIVNYLEVEILKINKTIEKIKEKINLLEEYKTSLIHHVVTGKIDVRDEV